MVRRPHPRLALWKRLWKRDPEQALAVCDAIIASRPIPTALLRDLAARPRPVRFDDE